MKLAWILWMAQLLPQPIADPLCLTTTVYLEARDQAPLGQQAVAEVAMRRRESGRWGDSVCEVVTSRGQFAPAIVHPGHRLKNPEAWHESAMVAFQVYREWQRAPGQRQEVVPGASHFVAHGLANPAWTGAPAVARIGDHTFYEVERLAP